MSILREYEEIKKELGEKEWNSIEEYVDKHDDIYLSDVLYKEKEYNKFSNWKDRKYIKETTDKVWNNVNQILQNDEYQNFKVDYIMIDKKDENKSFAIISNYDEIASISLEDKELRLIPEYDYNFDTYFLEDVHCYEIGYISNEFHYNIWNSIDETYPTDISDKDGLQVYLKYCKDKGITKEFIDKETKLDTPNIMKYQYSEPVYYKDDKSIVMTGVRNGDTKIALVMIEANKVMDHQYVIAFDYKVDIDNISWSYGKYYGNDYKKAIKDTEKAIAGYSLADSFTKSNNNER